MKQNPEISWPSVSFAQDKKLSKGHSFLIKIKNYQRLSFDRDENRFSKHCRLLGVQPNFTVSINS